MNNKNTPEFEIPYFDHGDWTVNTRHGLIWWIWPDKRNNDPSLYLDAVEATKEIIKTGKPLFGGWR